MVLHEINGMVIGDNIFRIRYHWGGDLAFLLTMLGLKQASSTWWCPGCLQQNMNNQWWLASSLRDIKAELEALFSGTEAYGRIKPPVIAYWYNMKGRIHYCALHANISFTKGLLKAFIRRAIVMDEKFSIWSEISTFREHWDKLEEKYGQNLQDLYQRENSFAQPMNDLSNFLKEMGYEVKKDSNIEEPIQDSIAVYEEMLTKMGSEWNQQQKNKKTKTLPKGSTAFL